MQYLREAGCSFWKIDSVRYEASFFWAEILRSQKETSCYRWAHFDAPDPAIKVCKYLSQSNTKERTTSHYDGWNKLT